MARKEPLRYTGTQEPEPVFDETALNRYENLFSFETPLFPKRTGGGVSAKTKAAIKNSFAEFTDEWTNSLYEKYINKIVELRKMEKDGFITPAMADNAELEFIQNEIKPAFDNLGQSIQNDPRALAMLNLDDQKIEDWIDKTKQLYYGKGSDLLKIIFGGDEDKSISKRAEDLNGYLSHARVVDPEGTILDYQLPTSYNQVQSDYYKTIPVSVFTENGWERIDYQDVIDAIGRDEIFSKKAEDGTDKFFLINKKSDIGGKQEDVTYIPDENGVPTLASVTKRFDDKQIAHYDLTVDGAPYQDDVIPKVVRDTSIMSPEEKADYLSKARKPVDGMWIETPDGRAYYTQGGKLLHSPTLDIAKAYGYNPETTRKDFTDTEIESYMPVMYDEGGNAIGSKQQELSFPDGNIPGGSARVGSFGGQPIRQSLNLTYGNQDGSGLLGFRNRNEFPTSQQQERSPYESNEFLNMQARLGNRAKEAFDEKYGLGVQQRPIQQPAQDFAQMFSRETAQIQQEQNRPPRQQRAGLFGDLLRRYF